MTTDNILLYHLQKLQEVGYKGIHIVNSTETTVNLTNPDTNQTIARVPAKLVETTYSTVSAPNETRRGYFLLTATNATAPNPGTTKGYTIFYEGSSLAAAAATTAYGSLLPPTPVRQVFDSFQLIAAPEVAQAIAQQAQAAETAEGRGGDNNDNGAHEHRGNDRDNRGHDDNGHGHNNGNGNREGGQGMAERIIEKTERMVDRIMSRR
jgi:hypothetical protein